MQVIRLRFGRSYAIERLIGSALLNSFFMKKFKERASANEPQLVIFSNDLIGQAVNTFGSWEREELSLLRAFLKRWRAERSLGSAPKGAMLDVGANIGNHSVFLRDEFSRIYAVEANPLTFSVLKLNLRHVAHSVAYNYAASARREELLFRVDASNMGGSQIVNRSDAGGEENDEVVQAVRLDDIIPTDVPIELIKIDVEGHELPALSGLEKTILKHRPLIVFEQHESDFIDGRSPVVEFLRGLGYARFSTIERAGLPRAYGIVSRGYSTIRQLLFGLNMECKEVSDIRPGFYEMVLAHPTDDKVVQ